MKVRALKNCSTTSHTLKEGVEYDIRTADAQMWIAKGLVEEIPQPTAKTKKQKSDEE